jgi:uncharacterized protein (DUF362 family)
MTGGFDRRAFLKGLVGGGAIAAVAGAGVSRLFRAPSSIRWDARAFPSPGTARVSVLRAAAYDEANLEALVLDGLRSIGADVAGARVLLKPNLIEFDPTTSINTDPRIVAAAAAALRRLGASEIVVGEAPGHRRDTHGIVRASGLEAALAAVEIPFVDLNMDRISQVALRSSYTQLERLWLPDRVREADIVVSMPKMKTHHWAGVTLSLKNLFGCLPGRVYGWPKNVLHWSGIPASILDISGAIRPGYAIVDGIIGMEGNGPIDGSPVPSNVIVVADDPVAADAVCARLMGFELDEIPYLVEAGRFLGQIDPDRIEHRGEGPDGLVLPFVRPPTSDPAGAA